jgi:sialate O-acetylesterase
MKNPFVPLVACCGLLLMLAALPVLGDVKLPALISDHMVLQADEPVPVWGWAAPGEKISVEIGAQKITTQASTNGEWRVELKPLKTGAHPTLTVQGNNKLVVKDVLAGEVWLGSGQSNMGLQVKGANNFQTEKAAADLPKLRMFTVVHNTSTNALEDCNGTWQVCNSNTVGNFSAALYFFGREIHRQLKVPVGLIHSSWGGTPIQPWMPLETLTNYHGFAALLERKKKEIAAWPARKQKIEADIKAWEIADAVATAAHQPEPVKPWMPGPPDSGANMPGQLYNAMIHPLIHYRIRGVVWYQGEANAGGGAGGAADYTELQSRLIAGWRQNWGIGDFPFYFVQLPNWNNDGDRSSNSWAFFREGQANILKVANTGMAVTIDIGDANTIHPKNKQEAGRRIALLALAKTYHKDVVCHGPEFSKSQTNGAEIKIYFAHSDSGLAAQDGALRGFVIAGADRTWHPADARIDGDVVIVSSPEVSQPLAVRYDWADSPDGNLYNGAGLPAMPFRTDHWQEPPPILGISHVAVKATDVEKSVAFYRDFLGYAETGRLKYQDDGSLMLVFMKVSDTQWIEIFDAHRLAKDDRLYQVCFRVADAEAMREYLGRNDFKVPAKVSRGQIQNFAFTVRDPQNYIVEFQQYTPEGWTLRDQGKFLPATRISDHIGHAGIVVKDLPAAQHFYEDLLGLKESWRGSKDGKEISWLHVKLPASRDFVEFMLETNAVPHFCLEVPDIEKARAKLEATPYFSSYGKPMEVKIGKNHKRQLNLYDPEGVRVELMEPDTFDGQPVPPSTAPLPPAR